jgi:hypothetical protein
METGERYCCADCDRAYHLTGLQRVYLEKRRERIDPVLDGPAYEMGADLQDDGTVTFRPATVQEQIDRLTAEDVWSRLIVWIERQEPEDVT